MKKLITLVMVVFAINSLCFSQTVDKKNSLFLELWVSYSTQTFSGGITKIVSTFKVDIGTDNTNNPVGFTVMEDPKNMTISIRETNGSPKVFSNNEVDLIRYLYSLGWEIFSNDIVTVASVNYMKYIFIKDNGTTIGKP